MITKRFGDYIKQLRLMKGLVQEDVLGKTGQSYLAEIESGRKNPAKRKTIEKLATGLQVETSTEFIDWLWIYSLLDKDPRAYFNKSWDDDQSSAHALFDKDALSPEAISIPLGTSGADVLEKMGIPDKTFSGPSRFKWIYEKEGIHVIFENNVVVDVLFK